MNYDLFDKNGYIKFTPKEKNEAIELAENSINQIITNSLDRENVKKLRHKLSNEVSKNKLLITEAKKLLYLKFLEEQSLGEDYSK